jgi:hypothetical protein
MYKMHDYEWELFRIQVTRGEESDVVLAYPGSVIVLPANEVKQFIEESLAGVDPNTINLAPTYRMVSYVS